MGTSFEGLGFVTYIFLESEVPCKSLSYSAPQSVTLSLNHPRMDIYYIEHASLALDLKILLLTPWAALSGKGAG